jgi:hypothetical protein
MSQSAAPGELAFRCQDFIKRGVNEMVFRKVSYSYLRASMGLSMDALRAG